MSQNIDLDMLFDELRSAQSECDAIDAELARLEHGDANANKSFFRLVDRRRLIGERLLATIEALEHSRSTALVH